VTAELGPDIPKKMQLNWSAVSDRRLNSVQRLSACEGLLSNLRTFQRSLARAARADGCTWQEIGQALGVTKQAAQQRFGMENKE
jgi:hypothetical protein